MKKRTHRVRNHLSTLPGVEAMTLQSDHAFPRHAHDTFGLGVILEGSQRSWSVVGQVEAAAGDAIMVNPGEMHDGVPLGGARAWRIVYLDPEIVARTIGEETGVADFTMRPVARDGRLAARIARLAQRVESGDRLAAEEDLAGCLLRVFERHEVRGPRRTGHSPSVARAVQRLDDAPEVPISLDALARACDATRFQLLRGFAREVGTTPHAYLVQKRVSVVRRLLASGLSLADAASAAGFADQSHMTRAFARHVGVSPGRYRDAAMRR